MDCDLSVVVVSFNTRDLLRDCLRSVLANLPKPLTAEVWVVDNASGDGSAAMVAAEFPAVRLIANAENRGFAAANNQALGQCGGRYVLLLNPDTVVLGETLEQLVRFMEDNPRVGAAGVSLLNSDGSFQHSAFRFPSLPMSFFDFFPINHRLANSSLNGRYPRHRYDGPPFAIDHPLGACFVVRRSAAEQVGWLDEDFYIYCEEIDWCLRLKRAGWQIYCVTQARVVHYAGQSTRQFRGKMLVELHRSRILLFRKHYGRLFRILARQILRAGIIRESLRVRWQARTGQIDRKAERERLDAYTAIMGLSWQ